MKKLISFAVAGMFALSLAACGSSSSAAASSTESSAESTAASTADSAAADSDLAYLQNKGKMTIGYTVYEPMNYTDESGTFTGFDTELATAVCEKLGVEPDFVEINWDTKETELAAKSIDCIWNGLTLTDDREANMACTKPYVKNAQVVVMKADADYTSTADLAGKTVVAESGSAGETTIEEDEGLQQADFVAKSVQTDCLMEVAAGTADAAVLDLTLASAMIGEGTDYANLVIKDELNVKAVSFTDDVEAFTTYTFKPQLGTLGKKYGKLVPAIGAYLKEVEGNSFMAQLKADGKVSFTVDGSEVVLEMDDVLVDTAEKDGFVSSGDNNLTVVLDTNLTPELVEEGFVREIVSKVQTMRKEADFNVIDRIRVYYDGNARIAEILAANDIKGDVLAVEVVAGKGGELSKEWNINGEKVTLGVARV